MQDGYIFFLSNIRQFYVRGGAGTGKTWIAMKIAELEKSNSKEVLFLCASPHLANMVKEYLSDSIDVYDIDSLIKKTTQNPECLIAPKYEGIVDSIKPDIKKYDAILVDEAQDFSEDLAFYTKSLLKDEKNSRLGVFYDDVQKIREQSDSVN